MFPGERLTAVDEPEGRVIYSGTGLEQRARVGGTQPDQQAVVGRQAFDEVAQTGERKVRHLTDSGGAQQSTDNDNITHLRHQLIIITIINRRVSTETAEHQGQYGETL